MVALEKPPVESLLQALSSTHLSPHPQSLQTPSLAHASRDASRGVRAGQRGAGERSETCRFVKALLLKDLAIGRSVFPFWFAFGFDFRRNSLEVMHWGLLQGRGEKKWRVW